MNLILLYEEERLDNGMYRVEGKRARHLYDVLGARPGDIVRVGLLGGSHGTAIVIESSPARAILDCNLDKQPRRPPRLDLLVAIARPRTLQKLIPEVTSMGVSSMTFMRTWRVAKPFLEASILTPERYRPLIHDGLMQGRLTLEPPVRIAKRFGPFVEDELPTMFSDDTVKLIAHPKTDMWMADIRLSVDTPVALAIGPEGGFIPQEVESFERAGFRTVSMGPYPLRVETACVAALSQIELLRQQASRSSPRP